jgi:hypothetical protein
MLARAFIKWSDNVTHFCSLWPTADLTLRREGLQAQMDIRSDPAQAMKANRRATMSG